MKRLVSAAVLGALVVAAGGRAAAQQPAGSQLPKERNSCATCHGEADLWQQENRRLYVPSEQLAEDVHWKNGVTCHDCHGGDPDSYDVPQAHAAQLDGGESQPGAGQNRSPGDRLPFQPLLSQPTRTHARLVTQRQVCGNCHRQALDSYSASVHGHGLQEAGLIVTAVCTDCHGGHGIYRAIDPRSKLHAANVGATCAVCHQFIQERVQESVHGRDRAGAVTISVQAPGKQAKPKPSCTDCHQGHDLPHPKSSAFRLGLPDRCSNCHPDFSSSYARSLHGQLTELGYMPAAKCSDCHGSHDILPISEPASRLSATNRRETCSQCHTDVPENFLDFDPHADPRDAKRDPILHRVNVGLTVLLAGVFAAFGMHSFLWLVRSWLHVRKHGRPKRPAPGTPAYVRFKPIHRRAHAVLMVSFLGLALTGLPLSYSEYNWAQALSRFLGGFAATGLWHRIFGIANIGCLLFYCVWFCGQLIIGPKSGVGRTTFVFGPDSPIPNYRDLKDFGGMLRWFFGRGPKPTFERWTYWEKFDVWGACADIVLIGSTGIILWFPTQFCALLPGEALNLAGMIHGKLALLATGFIFTIHFFNTHLRAEKFPMDMSILTGVVSQEELEEERPELLRRLRSSGHMEQFLTKTPSRTTLLLTMLGGFIALAVGLGLLVGILMAVYS
jgi:cytochrome b subunit of formate dehydrogenase